MITRFLRPFGKRSENYALNFAFEIKLCLFANADVQTRTFRRSKVIYRRIIWNLHQNPNFPISQIRIYLSPELIFSYVPYNLTDESKSEKIYHLSSINSHVLRIKSVSTSLCANSDSEAVKFLKANQKCVKSVVLVLYLLNIYLIIRVFILTILQNRFYESRKHQKFLNHRPH